MVTRVQKWGNSLGLRLPKFAAEEARISAGTEVDVSARNGEIIVRPLTRPRYRFDELVSAIKPENIHKEFDDGGPSGRELI